LIYSNVFYFYFKIPVFKGAVKSILDERESAGHYHGNDGLGDQFYWWRKPEFPEKTTDMPQSLTNFIT
jgi:inosine-uridine nucleoside N-ribohydrolase